MDNKKEIYLTKQTYLHHLASSSTAEEQIFLFQFPIKLLIVGLLCKSNSIDPDYGKFSNEWWNSCSFTLLKRVSKVFILYIVYLSSIFVVKNSPFIAKTIPYISQGNS